MALPHHPHYGTFCPWEPSPHQRKYGFGIRFRGRAHEAVQNSWYYACKEADINRRRPGAYGPAKESLGVRFKRLRRELPSERSRWMACDELGIPRALLRRRAINRLQHRYRLDGFDPAVVRGKCKRYGKGAWEATMHTYVDPPESPEDKDRHVVVHPPGTEELPPTHILNVVERAEGDLRPVLDDEVGIQMPIHSTIAQAFLAHLQRLPHSPGLTQMKDYDENGVEIPDSETSEGDLPFITVVVPDSRMVRHLMYYVYHQDQEALLLQLCGEYAKPLLNNLYLTNQCNEFVDVRISELRQSEKIAKEVTMDDISSGLQALHSLHRVADSLGLSDDRFWNTLDVAHRVLLDAASLKVTQQTRPADQLPPEPILREAVEQELPKENEVEDNEAEEKVVEDMLLEDYIEEMEVEDMLLDDEEAVDEITHNEFSHRPRA